MLAEAELLVRDPPEGKRAEYRLTAAGERLQPSFDAIMQWSAEHLFDASEEPRVWTAN